MILPTDISKSVYKLRRIMKLEQYEIIYSKINNIWFYNFYHGPQVVATLAHI